MTRTVSDILARRRPAEETVRLLLDGDLRRSVDELRRRVREAKRREILEGAGLGSELPGLERALAEAEAAADSESETFVFRAVGRRRLEELKAECPPSADQLDRWREQAKQNPFLNPPEFDPERLAPLLIAASAADPAMTVEEARRLWDELSDGEAAALFEGAWRVNEEASTRPTFGTGTESTASTVPVSDTPPSTESR